MKVYEGKFFFQSLALEQRPLLHSGHVLHYQKNLHSLFLFSLFLSLSFSSSSSSLFDLFCFSFPFLLFFCYSCCWRSLSSSLSLSLPLLLCFSLGLRFFLCSLRQCSIVMTALSFFEDSNSMLEAQYSTYGC